MKRRSPVSQTARGTDPEAVRGLEHPFSSSIVRSASALGRPRPRTARAGRLLAALVVTYASTLPARGVAEVATASSDPAQPEAAASPPGSPIATPRPAPAMEAAAPVRRAVRHADTADFEAALSAFDEAEQAAVLSRDDLAVLFGHRAVVHFAVGDRDAMEADLRRLAAVRPGASLPRTAPPPVREAYRTLESQAPLRVSAKAAPLDGGLQVRAGTTGDPGGLVRHTRVAARAHGHRTWSASEAGVVAVLARPGHIVEWYAEAIGPGGVVLDARGSAENPVRSRAGGAAAPSVAEADGPLADAVASEDRSRPSPWWWVGTGTAAVVVGVVATSVALTRSSGAAHTTVSSPTLRAGAE